MSARQTLLRNTFWYGLVTMIGLGSGVVMSVVLARWLGPTQMGEWSYVLWATRTLVAIATLGFAVGTVRYTANALARDDRALAWGVVQLMRRRQLVTTALVVAVTLPFVYLYAPPSIRWALFITCLGLFPITIEHIYSHSVYGANRYDLTTQVSTIKMALQFGLSIAALMLGFGLVGLALGNITGTLISSALQRRRAQSIYPETAAPVPDEVRTDMRAYLVPLSVVVVLDALVWDRAEIFFLRLWVDPHEIAFYSLAFGLATKAMIVGEISTGALLPTFSALHGRNAMDEFRQVYRMSLRNVLLVGMPIAATLGALAPGIVTFLYGEQYRPVATLLSIMIVVYTFTATRKVAWAALRGLGDRRWAVTATGVAAAVNLIGAAILIPRYHTWGAVVGNTLAQLVATIIAFVVLSRVYGCRVPAFDFARITWAGVLAYGAMVTVVPAHASLVRLVLGAALGVTVYAGALVIMRVITTREWLIVVSLLQRFTGRRPSGTPTPPAPAVTPVPTKV